METVTQELFKVTNKYYFLSLKDCFPKSKRVGNGEHYLFKGEAKEKPSVRSLVEAFCTICFTEVPTTFENLLKGRKPCKCGWQYYKTPERREERVKEVEILKGIFRTTSEPIESSSQGFEVECSVCFHRWNAFNFKYFCNTTRGCPSCAGRRRYTDQEYIDRIGDVGKVKGFKFHSKLSESKLRSPSKVRLICSVCDNLWEAALNNTLSGKYSCPSCSSRGFNPKRSAHFYICKVETLKDTFYKYGISNNIKKRHKNLRTNNAGASIEVVASWYITDGGLCRDLEDLVKSRFETYADKKDLADGFTETIPPKDLPRLFEYVSEGYRAIMELSHPNVQSGNSNTGAF